MSRPPGSTWARSRRSIADRQLGARGAGVIVISSELEEVVGLCHRVLVMREGRSVGELEGGAISEAAILQLCYEAEPHPAST